MFAPAGFYNHPFGLAQTRLLTLKPYLLMDAFSKRIVTLQGTLHFYFNRIATAGGFHYLVSVVCKEGKTYLLQLNAQNGTWEIADPEAGPRWLTALETTYANAIWEQLQAPAATTDTSRKHLYL